MIECAFSIFMLLIGKVLLPFIVGSLAVGDMAFESEPFLRMRDDPIVWQGESYLRNRTGVDAEGLRARAQFLILQFHGIFLGTDSQRSLEPASLHKSLLHNKFTGESCGHCHVEAIADAPFPAIVERQRTFDGTTQITIRILQRTETVFVGMEPQRVMVATRDGTLKLCSIGETVEQRTFLCLRRQ